MSLESIRIVLVGTTHPGNIGATARAMNNMGLRDLVLVAPECDPDGDEATARAAGSEWIIEAARRVGDLAEAVGDCHCVAGLTARPRSDGAPARTLRPAAETLLESAVHGPAAWVFGQERAGLSNRDLDHCHYAVYIPTNPEYASLNVAQAVQLVAWETRMAHDPHAPPPVSGAGDDPNHEPASRHALEGLFSHLEHVCARVGFLQRHNPELLMRRMRRLFHKAGPTEGEVHMVRGLLSHVLDARRWPQPPDASGGTNGTKQD